MYGIDNSGEVSIYLAVQESIITIIVEIERDNLVYACIQKQENIIQLNTRTHKTVAAPIGLMTPHKSNNHIYN